MTKKRDVVEWFRKLSPRQQRDLNELKHLFGEPIHITTTSSFESHACRRLHLCYNNEYIVS